MCNLVEVTDLDGGSETSLTCRCHDGFIGDGRMCNGDLWLTLSETRLTAQFYQVSDAANVRSSQVGSVHLRIRCACIVHDYRVVYWQSFETRQTAVHKLIMKQLSSPANLLTNHEYTNQQDVHVLMINP